MANEQQQEAVGEGLGSRKIGIIGVGNMGSAILRGLLKAKKAGKIFISDAREERLREFQGNEKVVACKSNAEVVRNADVIILAVKPSDVKAVASEVKNDFDESKILISVAAGISTKTLETYFGSNAHAQTTTARAEAERAERRVRVVRVMPNIAALVGSAFSAVCKGRFASQEDEEIAKEIMSAVGDAFSVKESEMDAITGLSGSGVAFAALVIDALAEGGVHEGLPRELALRIAARTVEGAARMISAGFSPENVRDMTASPGGTTIRGILTLEKYAIRAALMSAVIDATRKAKEISKNE
ncbi:MAG: pyrroline-5-carboxylate reductase [Candidatus Methanospirare jalkutatii]|nr:pyrroline-5-carboxylate reductase [Candidatus Methanospirare jalkutatii]